MAKSEQEVEKFVYKWLDKYYQPNRETPPELSQKDHAIITTAAVVGGVVALLVESWGISRRLKRVEKEVGL